MTDYTNLLRMLKTYEDGYGLYQDAAAAIEALNRLVDLNTQRCEELRKQLREAHESYERHLNELEAQLPKRGEWILNDSLGYCECPFCRKEWWYTDNNTEDFDFCPSCGADLRAKMEVQE